MGQVKQKDLVVCAKAVGKCVMLATLAAGAGCRQSDNTNFAVAVVVYAKLPSSVRSLRRIWHGSGGVYDVLWEGLAFKVLLESGGRRIMKKVRLIRAIWSSLAADRAR